MGFFMFNITAASNNRIELPKSPSPEKSNSSSRKGVRQWSPSEDSKLRRAVKKFGKHDWSKIASLFKGRSHYACRCHYECYLAPGLNPDRRWSIEEKKQLVSLKEENPAMSWNEIKEFFPGRSNHLLRITYNAIKKIKQPFTEGRVKRQRRPIFTHQRIQKQWTAKFNPESIMLIFSKKVCKPT